MIEAIIHLAIYAFIVAVICGLIVFLIRRAPFIEQPWQAWAEYAVLVIAVLLILLRALPLLGVSI